MNEEPKTIWRRSWKGPLGIFLWVISLTALLSIIAFAVALIDGRSFGRAITISFIAGLVTACITLVIVASVAAARWFCAWRNLRRVLFVLVCLATLVALFYAEENLRGKYAWKKFKTEWAAKGKRFDLASLAPPPVADDQNFAMAPPLVESIGATLGRTNGRAWYGARVDALPQTNFIPRLQVPWPTALYDITAAGGWQKGKRFDLTRGRDGYYLKKWREYFETNGLYQMVIFAIQNPGNTNYPSSMIDPSTGLPLIGAPQDETNTSSPDETNDWLIFDPTTGIISGYRLPAATNVFPLPAEPQPGDDLRTWQRYYLTFRPARAELYQLLFSPGSS